MSDDTDVEQLLENFQRALDTLSNIGNVEALITKLDANKNRKLLKRVKHVVGEVHNKVGTIKDKVSKAYKRVKIRSSSESEDVAGTDNTDKDVCDREGDLVVQQEDLLSNANDEDRSSPIVGGKGKNLKRSSRLSDKSQKNKNEDGNTLENSDVGDVRLDKNNAEDDDIVMEDKDEASSEKCEEEMDVTETSTEQTNTEDVRSTSKKTDNITENGNPEKDNEDESSREVNEGTLEKLTCKIYLSLNKIKNKSKGNVALPTLSTTNSSIEEKLQDSSKELDDEGNEVDTKDNKDNENDETKHDKEKNNKKGGRKKDKTSTDKGANDNQSDSDEVEGVDEAPLRSLKKKDKRQNEKKDFDLSDDEEDKLKDNYKKTGSKENKKDKYEENLRTASDSDDIEADQMNKSDSDETVSLDDVPKKSPEKKDKKKNKENGLDISDDEVDKLKNNSKTSSSKKNKKDNCGENLRNASDSDDTEEEEKSFNQMETSDDNKSDSDETETLHDVAKRFSGRKDKKNNLDVSDDEVEDEANKLKDKSKRTGNKNNKNDKHEENLRDGSDSDDIEEKEESLSQMDKSDDETDASDDVPKKSSGKKYKNKNGNISDDDVEILKDTSIKTGSKKNKKDRCNKNLRNISDSDDTEEKEKSKEDEEKKKQKESDTSGEDEERSKKDTETSDEDQVVTIEDTPIKASSKENKDKNDERDSSDIEGCDSKNTKESIKTEEDKENQAQPHVPKIKLVDISKLLAPKTKPLDIRTPSPKAKKSVTFDSSVIILSSSDEETPKKIPKSKDQSPLKSAMRKSSKEADNSDSDSKENNENLRNRRHTRRNRSEKKKLTSDHSSDDSDFEDNRRSRRLRQHETNLKDKFSKLVIKLGERKSRAATRRLRSDDVLERYLDNDDSNERKRKKRIKDKKLNSESDDDDDSEKEKTSAKNMKRHRKKEILEESSLSDNSHMSDSDFEVSSKKKSSSRTRRTNPKKAKVTFTDADKDDPKFKHRVFISLPLFKTEELAAIYKRKKEIFEVKKLTNMGFTRRTRSTRNGSSKNSDDSDKPDKKRIKLTLKLNTKEKPKDDSSDDEGSSTEENKEDELDGKDAGKKDKEQTEDREDAPVEVDPLDVGDSVIVNADSLAETCLEQIQDNSDKENSDKKSDKSSSDEDEETKKKSNKKKNKDKDNEGQESGEESPKDSEKKSVDKDKNEEPKVNGVLSDSEEDSDKNKKDDKKDEKDTSDGRKKDKNWKNDKLLTQKIDSSDSDDDFTKFSKKKDKTNSELVRKAKKRIKKSAVISDSDSDEDSTKDKKKSKGSDDDDDEDYKSENNKSSESSSGSEKEDRDEDSGEEKKKKPARKRIKRVKDSSSDEEDKSTRKHIRRMIDRDSLSETTKKAEQDEKERKARITEKQKKYNQIFELKADATVDKVVLDFDEKTDKPLLSVSKKLVKKLKPHQVQGVKFMWDASFESLERLSKDKGSGCILAHCMGLGKTLQVIALSHTLLTNSDKTKVDKILVVCPVNTVLNWKSEFKKWIPKDTEFEVYELVSCRTSSVNHERNYVVREWHENGGVLIIGYTMFRTLSNPDNKSLSKKLRKSFYEGLVDPGPDLVVCDEGHLLKNEKTNLSIAMNRIKTLRRIVLTGTPLQNNLREYWCMVQFIKPNLLGTYKEYMNRFVNPITNGQYTDSTQHDIVVMRRRSHVLHKLLDGVVQRQDYSVLEPYLPPKYEYVLFVKLTEVQIKLYNHYLENLARKGDGSSRTSFLFTDFQQFQRISTHPRVLLDKSIEDREKKELNDDSDSEGSLKDFINDESDAESTSNSDSSQSGSDASDKKKKRRTTKRSRVTRAQAAQKRENGDESEEEVEILEPKQWWQEYIDKEELDNIDHSAKLFLLFEILKECEEIGDKILVFSQSLYTLNCIEYFLQRIDEATQKGDTVSGHSGSWAIGLDYFRLDGSSSCDNRASWCDQFNDPDNTRARLFLISTKAGGLGINLVAANRVIIFDVSWNPSHDIQSIYRVYRFGQTKPSYIYRFVTYGAMEMKIYERQVTKQAISKRVIDEQQIDRHYSQNDIQELYKTDLEPTDRPIPLVPKDVLLGEMLQKYDKTIFKYHEHQSLLENKQDEELNEEERKAAWEEFENEKVIRKTTVTNIAGINMTAFQNSLNFSPQLIQVALANIVRKDNPTWSEVQIRGILPALVTQLQMQMSENDFSMYNRVQQEIRLMQAIQAQRMRENYLQQYQLQQMLQKQQLTNQMLGNLNVTPEELRRMQSRAQQNYIQQQQPRMNPAGGGSGDVIELND